MRAQPKPRREKDAGHLSFIRELPCIACAVEGRESVERSVDAAHVSFLGAKGLSSKVGDVFTAPLCREHHDDQHDCGNERLWWARLGVRPASLCEDLARARPNVFNGREVIRDHAERARRLPKLLAASNLPMTQRDAAPPRVTINAHLAGGADADGNLAVFLPTTTGTALAHVSPDAVESNAPSNQKDITHDH